MSRAFRSPASIGLFSILTIATFAIGLYAPWWALVGPSLLSGFLTRMPSVRISMISSVFVWCAVGLYHDIPTGFRLSSRIAGILGLPWSIFAYIVVAIVAMALSGLAAQMGRSLAILFSGRDLQAAEGRVGRRGD